MNIAIVGAGFAGLSTAKVLKLFGHRVTVFEKAPDVGGVWSASRRYPGLTTQNPRDQYALSDFPMPQDYPEWPSGEQVQAYLQSYAEHFDLLGDIRLNTEVINATLDETQRRWTVTSREQPASAHAPIQPSRIASFDHLVVCNGIFCDPAVPRYAGLDAFVQAGGRVCHTCDFNTLDDARGKHVLVVGYGKSSCDVASAIAETSASTTVLARHLIWKIPKKFFNRLNFKFLLMTRMGEALFRYSHLKGFEKFLHGPGLPIRNSMLDSVQAVVTRQLRLRQLDLVPSVPLETIARSTVSLVSDRFYEQIGQGKLTVRKNAEIERLDVVDGQRVAVLKARSDSAQLLSDTVPADIVVCGTGFHQRVPFFSEALMHRLTDERGNFRLYRQTLPIDVPCLAFNGYNSSFFSQLSAEVGALWLAHHLAGGMTLPRPEEQRRLVDRRLRWMEERTEYKHAKGTNLIPFSMHQIDELLADMKLDVGTLTRVKEWLNPVNPSDYAKLTDQLLERHRGEAPRPLDSTSVPA
ncbi:MAG: Cyclohexanone monooxygenase [Rhizobacter sp.]|nr:Cyclohexanone monooxygenase [Rhizobacter sp.]